MPQRDDPLKRRPRAKTREDIEDEIEKRLSGQLAHLMRDARYLDGDPDYRAYIHRQFRRVYDDPSGKPKPLRIGRPKPFVDELEPFDPARERRLRLGQEKEAPPVRQGTILTGGGRRRLGEPSDDATPTLADANRRGGKPSPVRQRKVSSSADQPLSATRRVSTRPAAGLPTVSFDRLRETVEDMLLEDKQRSPDDPKLREELEETINAVKEIVEIGRDDGFILSSEFLDRYVKNEGGTYTMPWSLLRGFSLFRSAEKTVRNHYENWFLGATHDDVFGEPFLRLQDGETIKLGTDGSSSRVRWDAVWKPNVFSLASKRDETPAVTRFERDFIAAFGAAAIKDYGNLSFTRRGDVIYVAGRVDMRFDERYDFEDDFGLAGWVSTLSLKLPNVTASDLRDLEVYDLAKPFRTQSSRLWLVTGFITLVDGQPDRSKSKINWRELDRDETAPDDGPVGTHPVLE